MDDAKIKEKLSELGIIEPLRDDVVKELRELNNRYKESTPRWRSFVKNFPPEVWEQILDKEVLEKHSIKDGEYILKEALKAKSFLFTQSKFGNNHTGWYIVDDEGYDASPHTSEYCCDCKARKKYDGEYLHSITLFWDKMNIIQHCYSKSYDVDPGGDKVIFNNVKDWCGVGFELEDKFEHDNDFKHMLCSNLMSLMEADYKEIKECCNIEHLVMGTLNSKRKREYD